MNPTTSHMRCKVCRAATVHRTARFGMCPKHEHLENVRRREERRRTKARRAQRYLTTSQAAPSEVSEAVTEPSAPLALEEEPMPKIKVPDKGRVPAKLSDDIKLEIAAHYANNEIPVSAIQRQYQISPTSLHAVLAELQVEGRGTGTNAGRSLHGQFVPDPSGRWKYAWVPGVIAEPEPEIPAPVHKALESMLTEPDRTAVPPRLTPRPEPVAPTPAVDRRVRTPIEVDPVWAVTVQGVLLVPAVDLAQALDVVRREHPDLIVKAINPA